MEHLLANRPRISDIAAAMFGSADGVHEREDGEDVPSAITTRSHTVVGSESRQSPLLFLRKLERYTEGVCRDNRKKHVLSAARQKFLPVRLEVRLGRHRERAPDFIGQS